MNPRAAQQAAGTLVDAIDRLLPQTQCTRCGYPHCRAYALALAGGEADLNRCPPGGRAGIEGIAALLGREAKPLDPDCGEEKALEVAMIDEPRCIGCALCIAACPLDAIIGAKGFMHTVVAAWCSGCELCLPACPVDCIQMRAGARAAPGWNRETAEAWRARFDARRARLDRTSTEHAARLAAREARLSVRDRAGTAETSAASAPAALPIRTTRGAGAA
ncbi:MAG: RnfABCDGE type electron transport complex subunit B [Burkholderiales bacterium]|nr:RnfABCDGE type electron transport complex subunit B [Burkholderiales bacterium]